VAKRLLGSRTSTAFAIGLNLGYRSYAKRLRSMTDEMLCGDVNEGIPPA
jgi:hypothetical protein